MQHHLLGQTCALLAAVAWAYALVLFKQSGERIAPVPLNLFKNTLALILFIPTMALELAFVSGSFAALQESFLGDVCILMLSGIIGIAIADTLLFYALNLIGVGLLVIVDCSYSPAVLLVAWLLLCETLAPIHYVGGALIIAGVFIASGHTPPAGRTRAQITGGVLLALLSIATMAVGIVIAKPILKDFPLVSATALRLAAGTVFLALFALLGSKRKQNWTVFRPSESWRFAVPGAVLGSYAAMVFWIAGFKYTYVTVAAVLNQTSVIFAGIFAVIILKEAFGPRKIAAVVLALAGTLVVTCSDWIAVAWRTLLAALAAVGVH